MSKRILIFRTDRVGDLIVTCPAILTIKEFFADCKITLISSSKNIEYAKNLNIFTNIINYPFKGFLNKIKFIHNLRKQNFDYIFIFDGKERSFISSLFIKSNYKGAVTTNLKKYHKLYNINFFKFDDNNKLYEVFQNLLNHFHIDIKIKHYDFISKKIDNNFSKNLPIKNYIHVHLDEKWFNNSYIKSYTDISPIYDEFIDFLNTISKNNDVLITTGMIDFDLLINLKNNFFKKIDDKIYFKKNYNKNIYFVYKPSIFDIESLIKNSKCLITCHGSLTHIANHFKIKIFDIIQEDKMSFYNNYTYYLNNYNYLFRKNFTELKNDLLNSIKE